MLVTRPQGDAILLSEELASLGYDVLIEPLLSIEPYADLTLDLGDVQALVLTSANAVPALPAEARNRPVYAVGEATAAAARKAECGHVYTSEGNVGYLSKLIVENCRPEDGVILHLSGEVIREGLAAGLRDHGFQYRRVIAYRAVAKTRFSEPVVAAWRGHSIEAVLLFSPRTSEILVDLLRKHRLEQFVDRATALCISQETATPCRDLVWKSLRIAARPNRPALLEQLVGSIAIC